MTTTGQCPECSSPLEGGALHALCPRCLLQAGLGTMSLTTTLTTAGSALARSMSFESDRPEVPGYELGECLGRGGFGEVWSAVQSSTGQKVAVKVLHRHADFGALEREVSRLGSVAEHPNVVTLLDANLRHGLPYLVTPLLAGSLASRVGQVDVRTAAAWFEQMARALQYVHGKGILHCDLKPANVLLDDEGAVRIVDFGQAHVLGEAALRLGTLWFMPPEQADIAPDRTAQAAPDVSWDVYSLGATMYRILTGRLPRATEAAEKVLGDEPDTLRLLRRYRDTLLTAPLTPIRTLNPRVDPDLACIVEHCLGTQARYPSMPQVLEDLKRRREKFPLLARRRTPGYVLGRFMARYPIPMAAALALAVILLVSFLNITTAEHREMRARLDAQSRLAGEEFERGLTLIDQDHAEGLLWLARAVKELPSSTEYRMAAQNLLRGWPRLQLQVPLDAEVLSATYSPDGQKILTTCADGTARVWNATDGSPITAPLMHDPRVMFRGSLPPGLLGGFKGIPVSASFNAGGDKVLTAGGFAMLWDAGTGKPVLGPLIPVPPSAAHPQPRIFDCKFSCMSPDDSMIVTLAGKEARLWDAATGQPLLHP